MKVLCFHGMGDNIKILSQQLAPIQSHLPDFDFEFVEGTVPHDENSWMSHPGEVEQQEERFSYYKLFDLRSILEAEIDILDLVRSEQPPFDGVVAFSAGCGVVAQAYLRHERQKAPGDLPLFEFMVFCNGVMPIKVTELPEIVVARKPLADDAITSIMRRFVDLIAQLRLGGSPDDEQSILEKKSSDLQKVNSMDVVCETGGTVLLKQGDYAVTAFDPLREAISIPTLHIWDPVNMPQCGRGLLELCNSQARVELHHQQHHDFPRGYTTSKKIAELIRKIAGI